MNSYTILITASRRTVGATVFSSVLFTIKARVITNSGAFIAGVLLTFLLIALWNARSQFELIININDILLSFLAFLVSLIVPALIMLNASTKDPKLVLSREY